MTTAVSEIIVTADNPDWVAAMARRLVEERWCACAQLITPVRSIYRWEGTVHDDAEVRVALHTRAVLVPDLVQRIKSEHPYEVPCILAIPVEDANPDYVAWVEAETARADG